MYKVHQINKYSYNKHIRIFIFLFVVGFTLFFGNPKEVNAAVRTWTGATSGAWSLPSNWGGTAPVTGDDLVFPGGASNLSNTNDLTETKITYSINITINGYTMSGNNIILGTGTDFQLFLGQMANGNIYYDPGIKMENASTKPKIKKQSQFRIKSKNLPNLYKINKVLNITK